MISTAAVADKEIKIFKARSKKKGGTKNKVQ